MVRGDQALTQCQMVIHEDSPPTSEQHRLYNGPARSVGAVIVPNSEDGELIRRCNALRRRTQLSANRNKFSGIISVSHHFSDPLYYILHFPDGNEGWYAERRASEDSTARSNKTNTTIFYGIWSSTRPSLAVFFYHVG